MSAQVRPGRTFITFLCCVLALPTCTYILPGVSAVDASAAVSAGVILGLGYLLLRPLLRILTLPVGCLTLGLFNTVIDVGLIYLSDYLIEGFSVEGLVPALLAAILVNSLCAIVGGFR